MKYVEKNPTVNEWITGVEKNRGIDAERILDYCKKIEGYAKEKENKALLGFAYYYSGETYYGLNDGENLFKYISKALTYLDEAEEWELMARAYNIMAIAAGNRGNISVSMDYYLAGLSCCKKSGLANMENVINLNLGTLYLNNEQYNEAQHYFEMGYSYANVHREDKEFATLLTCIYLGLGRCYMMQGMLDKAGEYCDKLEAECVPHMENILTYAVLCFKARYYHLTKRETARDNCIEEIRKRMNREFAIMDIFDDLYDVCKLLLELERNDMLWEILNILEDLAKRAKIVNLQRKIISLKIKYYRACGDGAGFLQAAG